MLAEYEKKLRRKFNHYAEQGVQVRLDTLIVGDPDAGLIFARSQENRCKKVGIEYKLHTLSESSTDADVQRFITDLSNNPEITGILLNLPCPGTWTPPAAQYTIGPIQGCRRSQPCQCGVTILRLADHRSMYRTCCHGRPQRRRCRSQRKNRRSSWDRETW